MDRLGTAAQDHAIAGLEAKRSGIDGHIRARFVNHRDDAEWNAHTFDHDAIRTRLAMGHLTHRISQVSDFAQASGNTGNAPGIQTQTIKHGLSDASMCGLGHVECVGGKDQRDMGIDTFGHRDQQIVFLRRGKSGDRRSRITAGQGNSTDIGHHRIRPSPCRRGG